MQEFLKLVEVNDCWIRDFKESIERNGMIFPIPDEVEFLSELNKWVDYGEGQVLAGSVGLIDGQHRYTKISGKSDHTRWGSRHEKLPIYEDWQAFVEEINANSETPTSMQGAI